MGGFHFPAQHDSVLPCVLHPLQIPENHPSCQSEHPQQPKLLLHLLHWLHQRNSGNEADDFEKIATNYLKFKGSSILLRTVIGVLNLKISLVIR